MNSIQYSISAVCCGIRCVNNIKQYHKQVPVSRAYHLLHDLSKKINCFIVSRLIRPVIRSGWSERTAAQIQLLLITESENQHISTVPRWFDLPQTLPLPNRQLKTVGVFGGKVRCTSGFLSDKC